MASGFFGKVPGSGDFVRRRLPDDFVQAWDAYASAVLAAPSAPFAAAWREAIEQRCCWAFVLDAGLCGRSAWSGVVAPQYDRVGRRFPMVVACPAGQGPAWFAAAAVLLQAAQAGTACTVADIDAACLALPMQATDWPALDPGTTHWWPAVLPASTGCRLAGMPDGAQWLDGLQRPPHRLETTR